MSIIFKFVIALLAAGGLSTTYDRYYSPFAVCRANFMPDSDIIKKCKDGCGGFDYLRDHEGECSENCFSVAQKRIEEKCAKELLNK